MREEDLNAPEENKWKDIVVELPGADSDTPESTSEEDGEVLAPEAVERPKERLSVGFLAATLLKGVIYRQSGGVTYAALTRREREVREYLKAMGLMLEIDDAEGYAYVRSLREDEYPTEDTSPRPPKLTRTVSLSFFTSFLLVMLRKRLIDFDSSSQGVRLILTGSEIIDYVRTFLKDGSNAARLDDKLITAINQAVKLGFLFCLDKQKEVRAARFEVRRIIRAFFDANRIHVVDTILRQYLTKVNEGLQDGE